jgi:hypothetical protein
MDFLSYISKYKVSTRKDLPQNNITHIVISNSDIFLINVPNCRRDDFTGRINNISENDICTLNIKIYSLC